MNELTEKYLVNDNDIIRELKRHAMQWNAACTSLLLSQVTLSLKLVLAGSASKVIIDKAELMLADIDRLKNHS